MVRYGTIIVFGVAIVLAFGCSGGRNAPGGLTSPSPLENRDLAKASHSLWGLWDIAIDPASAQVEIVPIRGAMFNCNVVRFLQPPDSPINLLSVAVNSGSDFSTGHLDLDVTIRHPFPGLKKFRGFDVRGIVMGEGSIQFGSDAYAIRAAASDLTMENPDGWTRWWNPTEFTTYGTILGYTQGSKAFPGYLATATINPYKYFSDGLSDDSPITDLDISQRGSFLTTPGINTRRYILQFPQQPGGVNYHFNYAVDASWALPDPAFDPDYPVEAFPPEANMQESWLTSIDTSNSTAWYVNENAKGGSIMFSIEIFDWQGAGNSNGVADEISRIIVESDLLPGPTDILPIAEVYPAGPVSSVWTAELGGLLLNSPGTFNCWIIVQADSPSNYAPQIQGDPNNFDWPDTPVRSYWLGSVDVSPFFPTAAPQVFSVEPPKGAISTVLTDVQILGDGFQSGANVEFSYDAMTSLLVTNAVTQSESVITCDLDCSGPLGLYDITVTNPDTQSGSLPDGFEVYQPTEDSIWWKSHMYNVCNIGRNPTVPGADPEALQFMWSSPCSGDKKYTTPVVADDKIFFTGNPGFYSTTEETIHCFDLYSGKELWSNPINLSGAVHRAFACPVWWTGPDGVDRVAVGGDQVYCYDADSGDELWKFDTDIDGNEVDWISAQMQEYDGMVLARARQEKLYVLDFMTGAKISEVDCASGSEGGCGAKNGKVYISSAYHIECADILSGQILWSTLLTNDAEITHWINPTLVNDRCYFSTYQGYVFCVATENDGVHVPGEIIWSWNDAGIPSGNNPFVGGTAAVVIDGVTRLFVAAALSGNYVYCLEDKGDEADTLWTADKSGYYDASPIWSSAPSHSEGVVYCPNRDGSIDAFDAATGHCIWQNNTGAELRAGVSAILDMLVVTSGTDVSVYKAP